jgi:hypothetical protein
MLEALKISEILLSKKGPMEKMAAAEHAKKMETIITSQFIRKGD